MHDVAHDRAVIGEIVFGHDAAGFAHGVGDLLGGAALIESFGSFLRDGLQRIGKIELQQPVAFMHRVVAEKKDRLRSRPARQPFARARQ